MKKISIIYLGALVTSALIVSPVFANEENDAKIEIKMQLEHAKTVLEKAQQDAEIIIRTAQKEAQQIELVSGGKGDVDKLYPLEVQNEKVSIEIEAGTLQNIVEEIMPEHWRVLVDSKDSKLKVRRFQFVSTRTREQSLNDLLKPIGLKHQYFFELKDDSGNSSPLLIVSAQ